MGPMQRTWQGGAVSVWPCSGRTHTPWALPRGWLGSRHLEVSPAHSPRRGIARGRNGWKPSTHGCMPMTELDVWEENARTASPSTTSLYTRRHPPLQEATKERPHCNPMLCSHPPCGATERGRHGSSVPGQTAGGGPTDSGRCRGPAPGCIHGWPSPERQAQTRFFNGSSPNLRTFADVTQTRSY